MDPTLAAVRHAVRMAPMPTARPGPGRRVARPAVAAAPPAPSTVEPSGVDELEIPTPTPDPDDFVDGHRQPLPAAASPATRGSTRPPARSPQTITVTVTDETREVAGVTTTVVRDVVTDADGEVVEETSTGSPRTATATSGTSARTPRSTTSVAGRTRRVVGGRRRRRPGRAGHAGHAPGRRRLPAGVRTPGVAEDQAAGAVARATSLQLEAGDFDDLLVTEDTTPLEPGAGRAEVLRAAAPAWSSRRRSAAAPTQVELVSFTEG